jgi:hypothetical protein
MKMRWPQRLSQREDTATANKRAMIILVTASFHAARCWGARLLLAALLLCGGSLPATAQSLADTYLELAWGYEALGDGAAAGRYRDLYLRAAYDDETAGDTHRYGLLRQHLGLLQRFLELQPQQSRAKTQGEIQQESEQLMDRLRELEARAQDWAHYDGDFPDKLIRADLIKEQADALTQAARRLNRRAEALKIEARQSVDEASQARGQAIAAQAEQLKAQAVQLGDPLEAAAASQLLDAAQRLLERDWVAEAAQLAQQADRLAEAAARLSTTAEAEASRLIGSEMKQFDQDTAAMRQDAERLSQEAGLLQARADSLDQIADAFSQKGMNDRAIRLRADADRLRYEASTQNAQADQLKLQADMLEWQIAGFMREIQEMRNKGGYENPMTAGPGGIDYRKSCPSTFPWPPPRASASYKLPQRLFQSAQNLGDMEDQLLSALDRCGYFERSFYCVAPPGEGIGFALAARMEQIDREAYSLPPPDRWSLEIKPLSSFSLREIMQALFFKKPGYFRIVVFIVYDRPFRQSPKPLQQQAALELVAEGSNKLSADIRGVPFSPSYSCTALIYEFEAPESGKAPVLVTSRHDGKTHLERARLLEELEKRK